MPKIVKFSGMLMRRGIVSGSVAGLVMTILLTGCAGGDPVASAPPSTASRSTGTPARSATPPPDDPHCLDAGEKVVRFPDGDATLPGVVLGSGTVGIIFGHQTDGDLCQWIKTARVFAARGYRALVFDFATYGLARKTSSPSTTADVVAASEYLKSLGVTKLALVGASFGGAAVITASVKVSLPVAAVVSLSSSTKLFTDDEPATVAAALGSPLMCLAAKNDARGSYATLASQMCASKGPGPRQLMLLDGVDHGVLLYDEHPDAKAAVDAFLAKYAPPV